jgi:hypothetical protein
VLAASFSNIAEAKLIELNNQNASLCRQQLLDTKTTFPVVMVYMQDCPWAKKLRHFYT